jgi:DNA-binding XRE family transcriptional regulator
LKGRRRGREIAAGALRPRKDGRLMEIATAASRPRNDRLCVRPRHDGLRVRVGIEVRVLRVMHGWTQEVLAELAGLHRNYVGYVERGERNVGIDNLERLANALGVPIAVLLRGE